MTIPYKFQRGYLILMLALFSRLLRAASQIDSVIQQELQKLPEGYIFSMSVVPGDIGMTLQSKAGSLVLLPAGSRSDLSIQFKHIVHAFLVFSFQEGTAVAFARDRMLLDGDIALAMKIVRCLDRLEVLILPKFIARMAVKTWPQISLAEKMRLAFRIYLRFVKNLLTEHH